MIESQKRTAAGISLGLNTLLTVLKFVAALLTGSVSLLSEAFHSGTDVVASLVAFLSIHAAAAPPDDEHPYGHGKIESLAAFGEGTLLLGVTALILVQSVLNLTRGRHPERLDLGLIAMGTSAVCAFGVGQYLLSVAKRTNSLALQSNGRHMMLDFWTSLGVLCAFALQKFFNFQYADSILGFLIGVWLGLGAWRMVREAFEQLIDRRVTDEEIEAIQKILRDTPDLISYHRLRSRHSGNVHYVDLHAVVPNTWSVVQAHALADRLEKEICTALEPAQVVVHIDPFDSEKLDQ
jgi:cation diffusion facilitator family transporter